MIMLLLKQIQSLFSNNIYTTTLMQTNKAQLISRKFMITQIITNSNIYYCYTVLLLYWHKCTSFSLAEFTLHHTWILQTATICDQMWRKTCLMFFTPFDCRLRQCFVKHWSVLTDMNITNGARMEPGYCLLFAAAQNDSQSSV